MLVTNSDFEVVSIDIRAVFLQANKLDREVFVRPPDDIKKDDFTIAGNEEFVRRIVKGISEKFAVSKVEKY